MIAVNRTGLTLMVSLALMLSSAMSQNSSDWIFREVDFIGVPNMTPSLYFDQGPVFKIESTSASGGVFKLSRIIQHPAGNAWELSVKVKVTAANIDLDNDNHRIVGQKDESEDNDGPNFFAFIYAYNNATVEKPGFITGTRSFSAYPDKSALCHVHFECNWAGDTATYHGYYCSSGSDYMMPGWVADGPDLGFKGGYSTFDSEAFKQGEWKTIKLSIKSGECMYNNLSIVFMGVDPFLDRTYTWEIKDVEVKAETTYKLSLEEAYDMSAKEYLNRPAYCGNARKDAGEQCDGTVGLTPGYKCKTDCMMEPICGDQIVTPEEVCDSTNVTTGYKCSSDCKSKTPVCGDGKLVGEEFCDPGSNETNIPGFSCSADCKERVPICGDGLIVGFEECDTTNGTTDYTSCSSECKLYRKLSEDENSTVTQIFLLANQSNASQPASLLWNFSSGGSIGLEDLAEQEDLKNMTFLPANHSFHFCVQGVTACEESYVLTDKRKVYSSNQTMAFQAASGSMKVYAVEQGDGIDYFIGFNAEGEPKPLLGEDWTWLIVIIAAAVIGLLILVAGFLVFFYMRKKQFQKKQQKKPEEKSKKDLKR